METHFGDKIVEYDEQLHEYIDHIYHAMSEQERNDLFHQARYSSQHSMSFSPRQFVHLRLTYAPSAGRYTLTKI